jgi:hypothetical protein
LSPLLFPSPPTSAGSDALALRRPSYRDNALRTVVPLRPHRPPPPSAPLQPHRRRRHETSIPHHRHFNFFHPRPPRPSRTHSPSATHRPETTPFAQSFHNDLIDLPPHRRRFNPTADAILQYSDSTPPSSTLARRRPPRPSRTHSPSPAHRPETTPFVQSLPLDPYDHPLYWRRFPPTATAATRRQFRHTIVDDGHQPPTPPFSSFSSPFDVHTDSF